jgi:hypothetical protein
MQERWMQQQQLALQKQQLDLQNQDRLAQLGISASNALREQRAQNMAAGQDVYKNLPASFVGGPTTPVAPDALSTLTQAGMTSGLKMNPLVVPLGMHGGATVMPGFYTKPADPAAQEAFNTRQESDAAKGRVQAIIAQAQASTDPSEQARLYGSINPADARTGFSQDVMALIPPGLQNIVKPPMPNQSPEERYMNETDPTKKAALLASGKAWAQATHIEPAGGGLGQLGALIANDYFDPKQVAKARMDGTASPIPSGRSAPMEASIQHEVLNMGGNPAQQTMQWNAAQRAVAGMTGRQADASRGTLETAVNELNRLDQLTQQMKLSGIPWANQAQVYGTMHLSAKPEDRALAAQYLQQLELAHNAAASVLKNGNSTPSDPGVLRAAEVMNGNWDQKTLQAAIANLKQNFGYRYNALSNFSNYTGGLNTGNYMDGVLPAQGQGGGRASGAGGAGGGRPGSAGVDTTSPYIQDPAHPGAQIPNPNYIRR